MFKGLLFAASLMVSIVSFASPKVGDSVTFQGVFAGGGGGSIDFEQSMTITKMNATEIGLATSLTVDGNTDNQDGTMKIDEYLSTDMISLIMTHCTQEGGKIEMVEVVAGQFETCVFAQDEVQKVWIGQVPFGIVKQIMLDEMKNTISVEVKSYTFAK